jgi:hypothetical protein
MSGFHRTITVQRRQFLRGAGVSLALPFLPSLYPGKSYGVTLVLPVRRRYFTTFSLNGCIRRASFFPSDESSATSFPILTGLVGHRGSLQSRVQGDERVISDVLRAPASKLSEALVARMNVLSGLDIPFNFNHNCIHPSGFYYTDIVTETPMAVPTIDQILAWSNGFYGVKPGSPVPVTRRSIVDSGGGRWPSHYYENPASRTGKIVPTETAPTSSLALFDSLFGNPRPPAPSADLKLSILDRVTSRWKSLRQSNRRMSSADRVRLDHHLEQLRDLEMRIGQQDNLVCIAQRPLEDTKSYNTRSSKDEIKKFALMNDLIAMAFSCDTTRVVMRQHYANFVDYFGSWDQDVLDASGSSNAQATLRKSLQATFEHTLLDLAQKLDQPQGDGTSLLDQCLLQWTQAFGSSMHHAVSMPVVTIGSGGHRLITGQYFDFRNRSKIPTDVPPEDWNYGFHMPGIHYGRWLRTVLDAMGVERDSYDMMPFLSRSLEQMGKDYRFALLPGQLDSAEAIMQLVPPPQ